MPLSDVDKSYNFDLVHGEHGGYFPPQSWFEESVGADIDSEGHIVAPCGDCNEDVRFDVDYDGDLQWGPNGDSYTKISRGFSSVDRTRIHVDSDNVLCAACNAKYDAVAP